MQSAAVLKHSEKIRVFDLFSGIGGFSLGLEQTGGFKTIAFCEIDPFCQKVLKKHWPKIPIFGDIYGITEQDVAELGQIDCITAGFPCQPFSCAKKRKGSKDERHLWPELLRVIRLVRPRIVLLENVPGLLSIERGTVFGRVLADLAASGYDAEWNIVSAASVGAPHLRRRVFIVAYSEHNGLPNPEITGSPRARIFSQRRTIRAEQSEGSGSSEGRSEDVAHANSRRLPEQSICTKQSWGAEIISTSEDVANSKSEQGRRDVLGRIRGMPGAEGIETDVSNPNQIRRNGRTRLFGKGWRRESEDGSAEISDADRERCDDLSFGYTEVPESRCNGSGSQEGGGSGWEFIGGLGGTLDGFSEGVHEHWRDGWEDGTPRIAEGQKDRVDRLRALGNAIVPQCAELVGRCILDRWAVQEAP